MINDDNKSNKWYASTNNESSIIIRIIFICKAIDLDFISIPFIDWFHVDDFYKMNDSIEIIFNIIHFNCYNILSCDLFEIFSVWFVI